MILRQSEIHQTHIHPPTNEDWIGEIAVFQSLNYFCVKH